jgi:hypothetical protein
LGSVLQQKQEGVVRVIAYYSRTLNKSERQYWVTRRELLAIVESIQHFHNYLYGVHFLIIKNHSALSLALKFRTPMGKMSRWMNILGLYDFEVEHRPGVKHTNADSLSRRPCGTCSYCEKREKEQMTLINEEKEINNRCIGSCYNMMTKPSSQMDSLNRVGVSGTNGSQIVMAIDHTEIRESNSINAVPENDESAASHSPGRVSLESEYSRKAEKTDPLRKPCIVDGIHSDWVNRQNEDQNLELLIIGPGQAKMGGNISL